MAQVGRIEDERVARHRVAEELEVALDDAREEERARVQPLDLE